MSIDPDAPAFPFIEPNATCSVEPGLTIREWFAGRAMQGLLSRPDGPRLARDVAREAVQYADAVLAEICKKSGG